MEIKEIRIKYGMTQNLGDYTNCRPEIEITAVISPTDDVTDVLAELDGLATEHVHNVIDDELEAAGQEVKYYTGQLYRVAHNKVRKCIVVYPVGAELPDEPTWKTQDRWETGRFGWPDKMRMGTAKRQVSNLADLHPDYDMISFPGDLIPPMPNDGPEPAWHIKNLKIMFERLQIPEEHWEELGELDHIDYDYLQYVYNLDLETTPLDERLFIIRENAPIPVETAVDDEYHTDDDRPEF